MVDRIDRVVPVVDPKTGIAERNLFTVIEQLTRLVSSLSTRTVADAYTPSVSGETITGDTSGGGVDLALSPLNTAGFHFYVYRDGASDVTFTPESGAAVRVAGSTTALSSVTLSNGGFCHCVVQPSSLSDVLYVLQGDGLTAVP